MKKKLIKYIKNNFSESQRIKIKYYYAKTLSILYFNAHLNSLATWFETDKWNNHWYTQHYHRHFKQYRRKKIKLLEIGIGGHNKPMNGGQSLRMWKYYFRRGEIFGLDIHDKKKLEEKRIKIFTCDQTDEKKLEEINNNYGDFDIIIDDGSHINEHIIKTFNILFPKLKTNGIYVIEDIQTSYWKDFGGNSNNINDEKNAINYFRNLVHCLNYSEIIKPNYSPSYFDENIVEIHFYHNLIFIMKGNNNEGSNVVADNSRFEYKGGKHFLSYNQK